jgi:RNA polymerase sigma-70 factor (ECF subfamily)
MLRGRPICGYRSLAAFAGRWPPDERAPHAQDRGYSEWRRRVPPEVEWFLRFRNLGTRALYQSEVRQCMQFLGITRLEEFRRVTNAQLNDWRTQLEIRHPRTRRCLNAELVSHKLFPVTALLDFLEHHKAVAEKGPARRDGKDQPSPLPRGQAEDDSQAVFELFVHLGRSAEIAALSVSDSLECLCDEELIARLRTGDNADALGELLQRSRPALRRFFYRLSGQKTHASDLADETIGEAWRERAQFFGAEQFTTWLFRRASELYGRYRFRCRCDKTWALPVHEEVPSVSAVTRHAELSLDLATALSQLPPEERSALQLCYVKGFTSEEAAAALGCPLRLLDKRLRRGKKKLRVLLQSWAPSWHVPKRKDNRSVAVAAWPKDPERTESNREVPQKSGRIAFGWRSQQARNRAMIRELDNSGLSEQPIACELGIPLACVRKLPKEYPDNTYTANLGSLKKALSK